MLTFFCIIFTFIKIHHPSGSFTIVSISQACSDIIGNVTAIHLILHVRVLPCHTKKTQEIGWSHIITYNTVVEGKIHMHKHKFFLNDKFWKGICWKGKQPKKTCQLRRALGFHCCIFFNAGSAAIIGSENYWGSEFSSWQMPFWPSCSFYLTYTILLLFLESSQTAFKQSIFHSSSNTML